MLLIHYFINNVNKLFYCLLITKNRSSVSQTQCIPIARYELPGTIEVYVNHVTIERFELPLSQLCFLYGSVFDFMQRHTDISPRVAACSQGRN